MATPLVYENKLPVNIRKNFVDNVRMYSERLGIDPNWLMLVMNSESGLNPQAENPTTKATGLIQFMNATAKQLGTTLGAIKQMSAVTQLFLVYKYFLPYKDQLKSFNDLYRATFFPLSLGKPGSFVMETPSLPAKLIYDQNPAIAKFSAIPGKITVDTFNAYTESKLTPEVLKLMQSSEGTVKFLKSSDTTKIILLGLIPIALGLLIIFRKRIFKLAA